MARVHLLSLKLTGFKSFPDRVELDFRGQVSGIIGPNGCGKSNVVDAMLFVLGEQSPSLLRLKSMGDLVFSGASKRSPAGAAEVVLELSTDDGRWEATGGRLEVRRRVYRSGPSEYRINGKVCRLKDVMDELMAVGLGTRDYAIIEQGRVGQVLSARPTDRRALLEEAAGITHYKVRRREAELKLEHTRNNLLRIDDVISEVDRSLRQLKRQAKQADLHQRLEEELRDRLHRHHLLEVHRLDAVRRDVARRRAHIQNEVAARAAALGGCEADLSDARDRLEKERQEVEAARAEVAELLGSRERLEAFLERSADLIDTLRASLDKARREQAVLETSRVRADEMVIEASSRRSALGETLSSVRQEVDAAAAAEAEARASLSEVEETVGEKRHELLRTISALTESRNRLGALERERDRLSYTIGQLEQELERQEIRRQEVASRYQEASDASRMAVATADTLAGERQKIAAERSARLQEANAAKQEVESLSHSAWDLRHRLAGIDRELARHAAALDQLRSFVPDEAIAGQVSDFLRPDPEWAGLLDRVWAEQLELPVIRSATLDAEQRAAAARLEGRVRVALAACDAAAPEREIVAEDIEALLDHAGVAAADLPWLSRVLPPAFVCDRPERAAALAAAHSEAFFLDRDGVLWRGATIEPQTAGSKLRGSLSLKADQESLRAQLSDTSDRVEAATARQQSLSGQLEELDLHLTQVEGKVVEAEQERARAAAVEQSISQELGRLEREGESLRGEIARNRRSADELEQRRNKLTREVSNLDARGRELEQAVEESSVALEGHRDRAADLLRRLDRWRAEAQLAGEREAAATNEVTRLEHEREQLAQRITRLHKEAAELATELERTENEVVRSRGRLAEEHGLLSAARERERSIAQRLQVLTDGVQRLDKEVRERRQTHDQAREQLHEVEMERTRTDAQWDGLRESTLHDLTLTPEQLLETAPKDGDDTAQLEREVERLRHKIDTLGPVNLLALKEVEELGERATFLKEQRSDLVESLKSLDGTIRDIDATCTDRFVETFEKVNVVFSETFVHLFGGGNARLELVDEDDPLESGIDITAQPPGKKTQSVQLLSGGEKALTALSLLIAMFRIKPSPFCILDEVDAPLDDANVERLGDLVRAMTDHTQFILVTHNRRTMARADVLYGVTMEEAGVSKVVSVRLEN